MTNIILFFSFCCLPLKAMSYTKIRTECTLGVANVSS